MAYFLCRGWGEIHVSYRRHASMLPYEHTHVVNTSSGSAKPAHNADLDHQFTVNFMCTLTYTDSDLHVHW